MAVADLVSACSAPDHLTGVRCSAVARRCSAGMPCVVVHIVLGLGAFSVERPRGQCGRLFPGGMRSPWTLPVFLESFLEGSQSCTSRVDSAACCSVAGSLRMGRNALILPWSGGKRDEAVTSRPNGRIARLSTVMSWHGRIAVATTRRPVGSSARMYALKSGSTCASQSNLWPCPRATMTCSMRTLGSQRRCLVTPFRLLLRAAGTVRRHVFFTAVDRVRGARTCCLLCSTSASD